MQIIFAAIVRTIRAGLRLHFNRLVLLLIAGLTPSWALATYVFNTIDYPCQPPSTSVNNFLWGINATNNLQVNLQVTGQMSLDGGITGSSFIYSPGSSPTGCTIVPPPDSLPLPAAPWTSGGVIGINDQGVMVGSVGDTANGVTAFILDHGVYSFFSRPGWEATEFRSINNAGLITGWSWHIDASGNTSSPDGIAPASVGFIFDQSNPDPSARYTEISIPGASPYAAIIVHGVNSNGQAVGSATPYQLGVGPGVIRAYGFLREPDGTISPITVNGGYPNFIYTKPRGINDQGLIAGTTFDVNGQQQIFVGRSNDFQILTVPNADLPNATSTFAEGINADGQVIGGWFESNGASHGFMATPAVQPTGTTSNGSYTFSVDVIPDTPVFIDPNVSLGFDYAVGKTDPLFATVRLPIGIGDNQYTLIVKGHEYALAAGVLFDFRTHGHAGGVSQFRVAGIEASAALDPANPQAFPTGLTFTAAGRFTGTMTPLCRNHPLPSQAAAQANDHALSPCTK